MVTQVRTPETHEQALRRLLVIARESGVRLGKDEHGDFWATSVSEPGRLYRVDVEACGCRGYQAHGHCRHVAALWSHLGYFDDPEPDGVSLVTVTSEPATCPTCQGLGSHPATVATGPGRWMYTSVGCEACHGSGNVTIAA